MRKFFKEFKSFISKGNVFDMAVGLIIATAFNKIVSSLVNDIIMPLVTWSTGANSLADLSVVLRESVNANGDVVLLTWNYGMFLQTVIDFLIIALSVFIMVKVVTSGRKKFEELENMISNQSKKEVRQEYKAIKLKAKQENRKFKEVWAEHEAEKARLKAEELEKAKLAEQEKLAQERLANPTQEDLLKEIRDLLKEQKKK